MTAETESIERLFDKHIDGNDLREVKRILYGKELRYQFTLAFARVTLPDSQGTSYAS